MQPQSLRCLSRSETNAITPCRRWLKSAAGTEPQMQEEADKGAKNRASPVSRGMSASMKARVLPPDPLED